MLGEKRKELRSLTGLESESERLGFTLFSFPTKHDRDDNETCNFEVQLALKYSPKIQPQSMSDVFIKVELDNINLFTKFYSQWKLEISPNGNFITRDPEDNLLIIETRDQAKRKLCPKPKILDLQSVSRHQHRQGTSHQDSSKEPRESLTSTGG